MESKSTTDRAPQGFTPLTMAAALAPFLAVLTMTLVLASGLNLGDGRCSAQGCPHQSPSTTAQVKENR